MRIDKTAACFFAFAWMGCQPAAPSGVLWSTAIYDDAIVGTRLNSEAPPMHVSVGRSPIGLAHDRRSDRLFVTTHMSNELWVVNATSGQVDGTLAVGSLPYWVLQHATTRAIYVANSGDGTFSIVDPDTLTVARTLKVDGGAIGFELSDKENALYFADYLGQRVLCVNLDDGTTRWAQSQLASPIWVALDARSSRLFVAESQGSAVAVLDLKTGNLLRRLATGLVPTGLVVAESAGLLAVLNHTSNELALFSLGRLDEVLRTSTGKNPVGGTLNADGHLMAISLAGDDQIALLDLTKRTVMRTFSVGNGPRGLAWIEK